MAKKPTKPEADDSPKAKKVAADKAIIEELLERNKKCDDADRDNRDGYRKNMRFTYVPGEQWDQAIKNERGNDRPMYQFNRMRARCKYVINGIRENRPSVKIRPFEEGQVGRTILDLRGEDRQGSLRGQVQGPHGSRIRG
jgi:hypothetical protein